MIYKDKDLDNKINTFLHRKAAQFPELRDIHADPADEAAVAQDSYKINHHTIALGW